LVACSFINLKHMFRLLNGFLGVIILILILKWLFPPEASDLAGQILVKVLTLTRDLLASISWPQ